MARVTRKEFLIASGLGAAAAGIGGGPVAAAAPGDGGGLPIPLDDLPTPALLLDGDAFDRNLAKMAAHLRAQGVGLRPHAKTHKSADIARKQLALGAVGLCCAKVSEAEALAEAGIGPLLVTSPLATRDKVARFAAIAARQPDALLVVDSAHGVDLAAEAAAARGLEFGVIIDLDVGQRRTGVACGDAAVALARHAAAKPGLRVQGVQAYAGHLMHVSGFEQRRQRSLEAMAEAATTRAAIEAAGIPCPIFTGGGTGTFDIDTAVPGITDLQCGSYPFMDVQYRVIGGPDSDVLDAFEPALFVWSTVISQPAAGRVTLDAGIKALGYDWKRPALLDHPGSEYNWGGDEHGIVTLPEGASALVLGDKVKVFVSHCDPTVNLHDAYQVLRGDAVVERWPVTARGCCQ